MLFQGAHLINNFFVILFYLNEITFCSVIYQESIINCLVSQNFNEKICQIKNNFLPWGVFAEKILKIWDLIWIGL